ncbi:MAG TPA: 30S ribosome-binding factor RbfA [Acidimicrobiales bacterium]|nr:30S ribosome-binding factor RbfA [Acidimicrobiales bacterium]
MVDRRRKVGSSRRYPRTLRVNEVLREVVAEELERLADEDPRLDLLTVTHVEAEPDLRHAVVLLASLSDEVAEALAEHRVRLQAAIGRQVRLKRTPQLAFEADPAVATGQRVDDILRGLTKAEAGAEADHVGRDDAAS